MGKRIVTIGGGKGQPELLKYLKKGGHDITAVVSMMDNGGSSGQLREERGVLPPGDARRCIIALAKDTHTLGKMWNARDRNGHAIGNLALVEKAAELGSMQAAIDYYVKEYKCFGSVLGVTEDSAHVVARLENGDVVRGEDAIDVPKHDSSLHIESFWLEPQVRTTQAVRDALLHADLIVLTMGDLYSSVLVNLLVQGVSEAIAESNAQVLYVCNRSTKPGETHDFTIKDFYDEVKKYITPGALDFVVVDSGQVQVPDGTQAVGLVPLNTEEVVLVAAEISDPEHPQWVSGLKVAQIIQDLCALL